MPAKKQVKKKPAKKRPTKKAAEQAATLRRKIIGISVGALLSLLLALFLWMYAQAGIVHLTYADVYLNDLPQAFDGTTVLYVSDLHMDGLRTPRRTFDLMQNLAQLSPDLLLLGGDFASIGLNEVLISFGNAEALESAEARRHSAVSEFAQMMVYFPAPLGIYAVAGEEDKNTAELANVLSQNGITLLMNEVRRVEKDGASIVLAGIENWTTGAQDLPSIAAQVSGTECVLFLTHDPDVLPALNNQPASDGGRTADLVLAGHTHAGQVRLFGRSLYGASLYGDRYRGGWYHESGTHMLVSSGIGTAIAPLRLGTTPQAHLLTLRCIDESSLF